MSVLFDQKAILIDNVPTFIFSGEFEYFRVPPESWEDRLGKLKAGGLNCVGLYFAWNYHSPAPGHYDFRSAGRDLVRLLEIVRGLGLYAVARPGPYICNEWDLGGYPGWLLSEDSGDWRTADPAHLRWLREWYRAVNGILAGYQQDAGGPIILYQIENEYRWDTPDLLDALYDYAIEDGITVPLIGNHDGGALLSGAKVTDGVDTYTGVRELHRWRGWNQSMYHRLGPDAPLMVLEFRGCDMALWGDPMPSEERLPARWIAEQEKLFTATGANLTNRFVAAGGLTPRPYHSDHITTEYGTRAAVAPWGEVTASDSFAFMRLWGEFMGSVSRQLATSKPWPLGWGTDNAQVECLARRGEDGTFLTLINLSGEAQILHITAPEPMPIRGQAISMAPGQIKVLVSGLRMEGLTIAYSTAEVLKIASLQGRPYVVLYGGVGEEARIAFDHDGRRVETALRFGDQPIVATAQAGPVTVTVYGVSTEKAKETWFLPTPQGAVPLFGGIGLRLPGTRSGTGVIETVPGSTSRIITPEAVSALEIDGDPAAESAAPGLKLWEALQTPPETPPIRLGPLEARRESRWTETLPEAGGEWRLAAAYGSKQEILETPGHTRWITEFDADDPDADMVEVLGVSGAECEFFLNGAFIGAFPEVRPAGYPFLPRFGASFAVSGLLRPRSNILAVAMNVTGRHNCGQPIYCGFSAPIVLRNTEREEVALRFWSASAFDNRRWLSGELSGRPAPAQPGYDRCHWPTVDLGEAGAHLWLRTEDVRHRVRWYHAAVTVPSPLQSRPLFLETSPVEEAWIYVDGECVGRKLSGTSSVFDLTRFSQREGFELTLAVRHNWDFFNPSWGLSEAPKLVSASQTIDSTWLLATGAEGERADWPVSEQGWSDVSGMQGERDIWVRRTVEIDPAGDLFAPVYVEMTSWARSADLYWNGEPIGLYSSRGPQTRFFIPDGLIREHNQITFHVTGCGGPAIVGELTVGRYCVQRRSRLGLRLHPRNPANEIVP